MIAGVDFICDPFSTLIIELKSEFLKSNYIHKADPVCMCCKMGTGIAGPFKGCSILISSRPYFQHGPTCTRVEKGSQMKSTLNAHSYVSMYRLFWDYTNGNPTHKLVRLSPLGNANWGPQCPVDPSESEAKTCSPDGVLLIILERPLLSAILGLAGLNGYPTHKLVRLALPLLATTLNFLWALPPSCMHTIHILL